MDLHTIEIGLVGDDPSVFETFERAQVFGVHDGRLMLAFEAGAQLCSLPVSEVARLDIKGLTSELLSAMRRAPDGSSL